MSIIRVVPEGFAEFDGVTSKHTDLSGYRALTKTVTKRSGLSFEERLARAAIDRYHPTGFGSCLRCQMRWDQVEGHTTYYDERAGCFPLCEDCWAELTPETRMPFYRALWCQWKADSIRYGYDDPEHGPTQWAVLETNVLSGL